MPTTAEAEDSVIIIPLAPYVPYTQRTLFLLPSPLTTNVSCNAAYCSCIPESEFGNILSTVPVTAEFTPLAQKAVPAPCSLPLQQLEPVNTSHYFKLSVTTTTVQ